LNIEITLDKMNKIVVTGAAGFIGSCLAGKLNNKGLKDIILVDDFSRIDKEKNHNQKACHERISRDIFPEWLDRNADRVDFVFHLGARTDTTLQDRSIFDRLNLGYSKKVWEICTRHGIGLIYASSAATYGIGEYGYDDDHGIVQKLKPLNLYGESKNDFDKWVLEQTETPPLWAGMKFFNVYGPNEYHKGRMASVIFHAFRQIGSTGKVKLFRSHNPDYQDGEQLRDFVFVKDVVDVLYFFMLRGKQSGLFNLGTGKARTFVDLARATFRAMDLPENIEFIDTPVDIRDKYQYYTEANMGKLRAAGYEETFYSLEDGVEEYVVEFLKNGRYF
jgi:ADP-L-glycero-D-manno-heptose 6-epimerase